MSLFQAAQERSSGVYKRNAKGLSFLLGLIVAISINVNAFHIVATLGKDDSFSEKVASKLSENELILDSQSNPEQRAQAVIKLLAETDDGDLNNLPIGWDLEQGKPLKQTRDWIAKAIGWIVSAIAISMGAPFWFNLLGKVMNVRNANKLSKTNSKVN